MNNALLHNFYGQEKNRFTTVYFVIILVLVLQGKELQCRLWLEGRTAGSLLPEEEGSRKDKKEKTQGENNWPDWKKVLSGGQGTRGCKKQ